MAPSSEDTTNDVRDGAALSAPAERPVEVELGDALESLAREVETEVHAAASPPPESTRAAELLSSAPLRIGGVVVVTQGPTAPRPSPGEAAVSSVHPPPPPGGPQPRSTPAAATPGPAAAPRPTPPPPVDATPASRPSSPALPVATPRVPTLRGVAPTAAPRPSPPEPVAPAPAAPAPAAPRPRRRTNSITDAFESLVEPPADGAATTPSGQTAEDLAAARRVFDEVAAVHVAQVRNVMLELRFGTVDCSWMESSRPALRSLRAMAERMELADLCAALDAFCAGVDEAVAASASQIGEDAKAPLLGQYQRLIELIPQAFELDAERDRREPIIVESLLRQVDGVEKLTIDKLFGVGLGRLDALVGASGDEIAAVAGIRADVAASIASRFRAYRQQVGAAVSAPDAAREHAALRALVSSLAAQHADFERAASGWSDEDTARKRRLRKERDQTFLNVTIALARLGERDLIARLERLPFQERIAAIETYLAAAHHIRSAPAPFAPLHGGTRTHGRADS